MAAFWKISCINSNVYYGRIDKALWWLKWNLTASKKHNLSKATAHTQQMYKWACRTLWEVEYISTWSFRVCADSKGYTGTWLSFWLWLFHFPIFLPKQKLKQEWWPDQAELHLLIAGNLLPTVPLRLEDHFPSNMADSDYVTEEAPLAQSRSSVCWGSRGRHLSKRTCESFRWYRGSITVYNNAYNVEEAWQSGKRRPIRVSES